MAQKEENYHLGCMLLDCLRNRDPEDILQIDASTGEEESYGSVLSRSICLARSMRNYGLKPGDVLALAGRNHLDLHIPHYAALFNGLPVLGIDPLYKYKEIKYMFERCKPRIAFCQQHSAEDFANAALELGLDCKIVTFDGEEGTLKQFIDMYDGNTSEEGYRCPDFDPSEIYAWLICTSGSTGKAKAVAFLHGPLMRQILAYKNMNQNKKQMTVNLSPVQWLSHYFMTVLPVYNNTIKLMISRLDDMTHIVDAINKYRPSFIMTSPSMITSIMQHEKKCDLTCFQIITITGAKMYRNHLLELKTRVSENAIVMEAHGQTETYGPVLKPNPLGPIGSCGMSVPMIPVKLVDPETGNDITEPHVTGELWSKGPCFTEYYSDPEATKNAFSEDGWFKTGDLLYRDEQNNYYFVDRMKMLIKYRNYHIYPIELEEVIQTLEGVEEVAVTGIPHELDSEHPVAFVVKRPGADLTADDIKNIVADNLTATKNLRGGVIFVDSIPKTSTGKKFRLILQELLCGSKIQ